MKIIALSNREINLIGIGLTTLLTDNVLSGDKLEEERIIINGIIKKMGD